MVTLTIIKKNISDLAQRIITSGQLAATDQFVHLNPDNPDTISSSIGVYLVTGRYEKALKQANKGLELIETEENPNLFHRLYLLRTRGDAYFGLREFALADKDATEVLKNFPITDSEGHIVIPPDSDALYLRGNSRRQQGNVEEALEDFVEAEKQDLENGNILISIASIHIDNQDYETAKSYLEKAIEVDESPGSYEQLGLALAMSREYTKSHEVLEEASKKYSASGDVMGETGFVYLVEGRSGRALESLAKAVRLKPEDAAWHALYGDALRIVGSREEALEQYKEAEDLVTIRPIGKWTTREIQDMARVERGRVYLGLGGEIPGPIEKHGRYNHKLPLDNRFFIGNLKR